MGRRLLALLLAATPLAAAPSPAAPPAGARGDVSRDLGALRHVRTVFLDGYRLDGVALRQASGLAGMPK